MMLNTTVLIGSKTTFGFQILLRHQIWSMGSRINPKLQQFTAVKQVIVASLWINAKYLHLGASPDGLILDDSAINVKGIVEMKCLKTFRGRSIEQIIQQKLQDLSRQCFKVVDNKTLLKTSHSYYNQIQLQLLVTEAEYCDFALHSVIGKIFRENI